MITINTDVQAVATRQKLIVHRPRSEKLYLISIFNCYPCIISFECKLFTFHVYSAERMKPFFHIAYCGEQCVSVCVCVFVNTSSLRLLRKDKMRFRMCRKCNFILVQHRPMDEMENYTNWQTDTARCFYTRITHSQYIIRQENVRAWISVWIYKIKIGTRHQTPQKTFFANFMCVMQNLCSIQ